MSVHEVTMHDGTKQLVVQENVCSVSHALSTDPMGTNAVFVMTNGFRICVRDPYEHIKMAWAARSF